MAFDRLWRGPLAICRSRDMKRFWSLLRRFGTRGSALVGLHLVGILVARRVCSEVQRRGGGGRRRARRRLVAAAAPPGVLKWGPKTREKAPQNAQKYSPFGAKVWSGRCPRRVSGRPFPYSYPCLQHLVLNTESAQKYFPILRKLLPKWRKSTSQKPSPAVRQRCRKGPPRSPPAVLGCPAAPVLHCAYEERRRAIQRPSDQMKTN